MHQVFQPLFLSLLKVKNNLCQKNSPCTFSSTVSQAKKQHHVLSGILYLLPSTLIRLLFLIKSHPAHFLLSLSHYFLLPSPIHSFCHKQPKGYYLRHISNRVIYSLSVTWKQDKGLRFLFHTNSHRQGTGLKTVILQITHMWEGKKIL